MTGQWSKIELNQSNTPIKGKTQPIKHNRAIKKGKAEPHKNHDDRAMANGQAEPNKHL